MTDLEREIAALREENVRLTADLRAHLRRASSAEIERDRLRAQGAALREENTRLTHRALFDEAAAKKLNTCLEEINRLRAQGAALVRAAANAIRDEGTWETLADLLIAPDLADLVAREQAREKAFLLIEGWSAHAIDDHEGDENIVRIFRVAHAIREPSCMHKHPDWLAALDAMEKP